MRNPLDSVRAVRDDFAASTERVESVFRGALGVLVGVGVLALAAFVLALVAVRK